METMRYSETKKGSKGPIIAFLLFVLIGGGLIYFSIKTEREPQVVGGQKTDETQSLMDIDKQDSTETLAKNSEITYKVEDKVLKNNDNEKNKCNITVPAISIDGEALVDINSEIENKYNNLFSSLKGNNVSNDFTYLVTYNTYDNIIGTDRILSITIYQRLKDDDDKSNATEKVDTYNINLATKKMMKFSDVALNKFGKDYKTKINSKIREYVVSKGYIKEDDYTYAVTGLENFYIKDSEIHVVFNDGEIVNQYLDIVI